VYPQFDNPCWSPRGQLFFAWAKTASGSSELVLTAGTDITGNGVVVDRVEKGVEFTTPWFNRIGTGGIYSTGSPGAQTLKYLNLVNGLSNSTSSTIGSEAYRTAAAWSAGDGYLAYAEKWQDDDHVGSATLYVVEAGALPGGGDVVATDVSYVWSFFWQPRVRR